MRLFLLLLIVVPALEIGVLIWSGKTFGLIPTILLIIATGIGGAYLAKYQGLMTVKKVQEQLSRGIMPGEEMIDGVCVLVGGCFLLAPGFLSDLFGFLLLLPPTRKMIKPGLKKMFTKWIDRNTVTIIR
ncbi:FxsA family protein [Bacillus massiliigorillae]|uniref:FxsA family protein n=1 Tax=Bacillus massiliigorillae TaxID=1243664 RepID=UPI0003A247AF|nr:FxsA family protein [Bacillus massiliigorillae]